MKSRRFDRRLIILLSIAIAVSAGGTAVVRMLPGIHRLELLAYAWHMRSLPVLLPDDRIVIVGMDDESLSHLPVDRPSYPLPRTIHAKLLHELHDAGARVVGFDVMLIREIPREDGVLADAMREQGAVLSGAEPQVIQEESGDERYTFNEVSTILRPYVRQVSLLVQEQFGMLRILPSVVDDRTGKRFMHMTMGLTASYYGALGDGVLRTTFDDGPIKAPVGRDGEIYVRLAGPGGTFKPIPYHEVFCGDWRRIRGDNFFKDKIVLVGVVNSFQDRHPTARGEIQGVEILAQETQSILTGSWITHWSEGANYVLRTLLCLLLAAGIWKLGLRRGLMIGMVEAVFWIVIAHEAFVHRGTWVDTVEPAGTLALSLGLSTAYETTRMRRVFQRFMPSWVADEMFEASPNEAAQTVEKEITVVFCDIRDSTKLGETLTSERMEQLLRRYFVAGEEAALQLGTELDKFVGDEIMLFFQERAGYEDHAIRAVRWALAIHEAARQITAEGMADHIGFRVGVGMYTGLARVGLVGARLRVQHTVVGDTVNTAARLQAATKDVGRPTVVGEATWARVKHVFKGEELGDIMVKGKEKPIRIYCPTGILGEA